jgi:hypothetical protein
VFFIGDLLYRFGFVPPSINTIDVPLLDITIDRFHHQRADMSHLHRIASRTAKPQVIAICMCMCMR